MPKLDYHKPHTVEELDEPQDTTPRDADDASADRVSSDGREPARDGRGWRLPRSRRHATLKQQEARAGLALVSPTFVLVMAMVILPVGWAFVLAFKDLPLSGIRDTGLLEGPYTTANFTAIFESPEFWRSLLTTLEYSVLGTTLSIGLGLAAALLVWQPFRGRGAVRAAMLIPYVAPVVGTALVWQVMLSPQFGITNEVGQKVLGWDAPIPFLSQRSSDLDVLGLTLPVPTALLTVVAFEAWRSFPFAFLFLIARLQSLPQEYDDAARVDGATPLQRFRYIILPQLAGIIALIAALRFIWTFNRFDEVYLLTGGGAGTDVVPVQVYNVLTAQNDVGGAAALTMVLGAVLAIALGLYLVYAFSRSRRTA
jgi:multiple sugar transport system permease protein